MATEFRLLGPLEVRIDGEPVATGGPRQRTMLAALLFRANEVVGVEQFAQAVWQRPPPSLRSNIRTYITALRRVLPRRLVGTPDGYKLLVDPAELDVTAFHELAERAGEARQRGDLRAAAGLYRRALDLWRGTPLGGLPLGPALEAEADRLVERRLHVVEQLVDTRIELGEHCEAISELRAVAAEHPFRERLSGQLMLALDRSGRGAEALEVYRETRRRLVSELGIEPEPRLRQLQRQILLGRRSTAPPQWNFSPQPPGGKDPDGHGS